MKVNDSNLIGCKIRKLINLKAKVKTKIYMRSRINLNILKILSNYCLINIKKDKLIKIFLKIIKYRTKHVII